MKLLGPCQVPYIFSLSTQREEIDINSSTPGCKALNQDPSAAHKIEETTLLRILESTSSVTRDIVEYVAGFIFRSLRSKLACERCLKLLTSNVTDEDSLIGLKNRGELVQPSQSVVKLCLLCE